MVDLADSLARLPVEEEDIAIAPHIGRNDIMRANCLDIGRRDELVVGFQWHILHVEDILQPYFFLRIILSYIYGDYVRLRICFITCSASCHREQEGRH